MVVKSIVGLALCAIGISGFPVALKAKPSEMTVSPSVGRPNSAIRSTLWLRRSSQPNRSSHFRENSTGQLFNQSSRNKSIPTVHDTHPTDRPVAILFDWDRCIENNIDQSQGLLKVTLQRMGIHRESSDITEAVHSSDKVSEQLKNLLPNAPAEQRENLFQYYWKVREDFINGRIKEDMKDIAPITMYPGMRDFLEDAKASGVKIGLLSNRSQDLALEGIKHFELGRLFDGVVGLSNSKTEGLRTKPHPSGVFHTVRAMGVEEHMGAHEIEESQGLRVGKRGVWFVGDSERSDVAAGKAAGIGTVRIDHEPNTQPSQADHVVHNVEGLRRVFRIPRRSAIVSVGSVRSSAKAKPDEKPQVASARSISSIEYDRIIGQAEKIAKSSRFFSINENKLNEFVSKLIASNLNQRGNTEPLYAQSSLSNAEMLLAHYERSRFRNDRLEITKMIRYFLGASALVHQFWFWKDGTIHRWTYPTKNGYKLTGTRAWLYLWAHLYESVIHPWLDIQDSGARTQLNLTEIRQQIFEELKKADLPEAELRTDRLMEIFFSPHSHKLLEIIEKGIRQEEGETAFVVSTDMAMEISKSFKAFYDPEFAARAHLGLGWGANGLGKIGIRVYKKTSPGAENRIPALFIDQGIIEFKDPKSAVAVYVAKLRDYLHTRDPNRYPKPLATDDESIRDLRYITIAIRTLQKEMLDPELQHRGGGFNFWELAQKNQLAQQFYIEGE